MIIKNKYPLIRILKRYIKMSFLTFSYIFFAFSQNITKFDKGVVIKYLGILIYKNFIKAND